MDWPLAAQAADHPVDPKRSRSGRSRLPVARADFFLDEERRLSDEERSLMGGMLRGLVGQIADELLSGLPALLAAQAEPGRRALYDRLRQTRLLRRDGVVALLLRRADEQQLSAHRVREDLSLPGQLVADADAGVAEAAMALTVARGRRTDRFGRLGVQFDDLAADDAVALVYGVAAALRERLGEEADAPLAVVAQGLLAQHDEGRRVEAAVEGLARTLHAIGRDSDELVVQAADARDAALIVALLARRAEIGFEDGWHLFTSGDPMMLARMARCDRTAAAQLLVAFESSLGLGAADREIERFDGLADADVEHCRRWLRYDPHYRDARDQLEAIDG